MLKKIKHSVRLSWSWISYLSWYMNLQVCDGASPEEKARWQLTAAKDYHYLNQSTCFTLPGVDNAKEFRVRKAC
jgi:myosin-5